MSNKDPDGKRTPAAGGAGGGAVFSSFILWILGTWIWDASANAENALEAISAVPTPVAGVIYVIVPAAFAYAATLVHDPGRSH